MILLFLFILFFLAYSILSKIIIFLFIFFLKIFTFFNQTLFLFLLFSLIQKLFFLIPFFFMMILISQSFLLFLFLQNISLSFHPQLYLSYILRPFPLLKNHILIFQYFLPLFVTILHCLLLFFQLV